MNNLLTRTFGQPWGLQFFGMITNALIVIAGILFWTGVLPPAPWG